MALAVALWGASSVAIKSVSASGIVVAFYRLWFAIPLLWLLPVVRSEMRERFNRRWLAACLAGGSLFFLHQVLFFSALKLTTVANVTIIGALQPGVVLLLAGPLFGERATLAGIFWTAIAFTGTGLVVLGARSIAGWSLEGDTLAFANLFAFSAYFLASKHLRATVEAWDYVIGMTTVSGLWMLLAALATGQDLSAPQGGDWLILLGIAALPGTLGHFLINWAHAHASALSVSVLLLAVPVIAGVGSAFVLD